MAKNIQFLMGLFLLMISPVVFSQTFEGAWELNTADKQIVLVVKDGYFTYTEYTPEEFISSRGGILKTDGNHVKVLVEFNSANSAEVGEEMTYNFSINDDDLHVNNGGEGYTFKRIDDGNAPLAGVWKITGRKQNGKIVAIHQTGPRKTLKMLTGNRFQWFAINPETKEFSGTGGGTYSFVNGKYTENILFFSRDNSRVGAQLTFDGKIEDGNWHHSGLSSKGDPIYEIWSRVKY